MKKVFTKSVIVALLIVSTITVAVAATYTALTATFPIFINDKEWATENPIVVIDGRTYLPLKEIGDVLGVKVNWNEEKHRVEVGEDATSFFERTKFIRKSISDAEEKREYVSNGELYKVNDNDYYMYIEISDVLHPIIDMFGEVGYPEFIPVEEICVSLKKDDKVIITRNAEYPDAYDDNIEITVEEFYKRATEKDYYGDDTRDYQNDKGPYSVTVIGRADDGLCGAQHAIYFGEDYVGISFFEGGV